MPLPNDRPEFRLENEVIHWCDSVYAEAEDTLTSSHDFKLVTKCIDYIEGRQWTAKARFGRNRPVKNRIFRQFIETVGLLTDLQPDFQVKIRDRFDGFSELEKLLNMMIVDWAEMSDFEMQLAQVVMYGLIHTGYAKIVWNSALLGGIGDVEFQPISPVNLMVVGSSSEIQEAECVIARRVVNMAWLKRKYGEIANGVRPDSQYSELPGMTMRPSRISKGSWGRLPGPLRALLGTKTEGTQSKYPQVMLKDFWFKDDEVWHGRESVLVGRENTNWCYMVEPGMPLWPRGRIVTIAGGKVLEDTCNPYWDAKFPFVAYRPYRVPWKFEGLCYDDQTEVLTRRGWLKFKDTNELDDFATREIETGKFEWQRAIARTEENYRGDMYYFHSRSMDMLVTPEHRMLVDCLPKKMGYTNRRGEAVITAREFSKHGTHHTKIPQTSVWGGFEIGDRSFTIDSEAKIERQLKSAKRVGRAGMTEKTVRALSLARVKVVDMSGDDFCAFMGAYLSEGWTTKTSVCISQHIESKGFDPFKALLERIFGRGITHTGKDFMLHRQGLRDYCVGFGKSHEKFIPEEIMNSTPRQLRIFWDFYMLGDGNFGPKRGNAKARQTITTTSKKMADQLVELAQKMGFSAAVYTRPAMKNVPLFEDGRVCQVRESYLVSLRNSKASSVKSNKIQYSGTIHCVTVPNSFLYVRRNGKPAWSGNSMLEPQVALQNIINRINGGVMDTIQAAIEPSIMGPRAAMSQGNWDALDAGAPGAKIIYNNNTPRPPEYRKPPELGSYVLPFEQSIEAEMDLTSGAAAMNQIMQKKQIPGGDSIEKINSTRSTNIRFAGRSLQSFLTMGGTMVIARNLQFADTRHRIAKFGPAGVTANDFEPIYGNTKPHGMSGESFVSKVGFSVKKGSLLAIEREDEIPIAFTLRKQGDLSRRGLYRTLDKNVDVKRIEAELKEEAAEKIALAGAAGALAGGGKKR